MRILFFFYLYIALLPFSFTMTVSPRRRFTLVDAVAS